MYCNIVIVVVVIVVLFCVCATKLLVKSFFSICLLRSGASNLMLPYIPKPGVIIDDLCC